MPGIELWSNSNDPIIPIVEETDDRRTSEMTQEQQLEPTVPFDWVRVVPTRKHFQINRMGRQLARIFTIGRVDNVESAPTGYAYSFVTIQHRL